LALRKNGRLVRGGRFVNIVEDAKMDARTITEYAALVAAFPG
jgi:hypothetical protein